MLFNNALLIISLFVSTNSSAEVNGSVNSVLFSCFPNLSCARIILSFKITYPESFCTTDFREP